MKKIIYSLFLFIFMLSFASHIKAEELKTVIKPDGKTEAKILLSEGMVFTSHTTGIGDKSEYDVRSPIKIWDDNGLIRIDGQHMNLRYGPDEKTRPEYREKYPWASSHYLSLYGYITEIGEGYFKTHLQISKYTVSSNGYKLYPCRIEGNFTFTPLGAYSMEITHEEYPEIIKCIGSNGEKQVYEAILISVNSPRIKKKYDDYLSNRSDLYRSKKDQSNE